MPTYRIVAKYQPKVDHELFGRFLNLVTSYRLKWTHDCNPDGTGNIYKITVHEPGRVVRIKYELIKLGMEVELTKCTRCGHAVPAPAESTSDDTLIICPACGANLGRWGDAKKRSDERTA